MAVDTHDRLRAVDGVIDPVRRVLINAPVLPEVTGDLTGLSRRIPADMQAGHIV